MKVEAPGPEPSGLARSDEHRRERDRFQCFPAVACDGTLGEKQVEVLAKIEKAKGEHDEISKKIQVLTQTLQGGDGNGGKRGEMETLEAELKAKCWSVKTKYDDLFSVAFEGFRGSSEKFKNKVLSERSSNTAELRPLADLEKKAAAVFQQTPLKESKVVIPDASRLLSHESNPILKKRVVGKDDVDIAAIIKKLGNSDWVQEGRVFYEARKLPLIVDSWS